MLLKILSKQSKHTFSNSFYRPLNNHLFFPRENLKLDW